MSEGEIGRLVFLVLLLALVAGSLFVSSGRGRQRSVFSEDGPRPRPLRAALIWGLIFAGLIIVYGQRDVLLRELFPREARQVDGRTIALNRTAGGAFVATIEVNGTPLTVLVDTGATDVVLTREDAARVGLHPDDLVFDGLASTANGMVRTARVTLDRVAFAGRVDRDVPASVNEGDLHVSLLGMAYLDRFERIEINGNRMLLIGG